MNTVKQETNEKTSKAYILPIALCWMVYVSAYLGRYSYSANISVVIDTFGVTRADAGLVSTLFFFAYGIGQVVNGIMSKYYPRRIIIPIALLVSALVNGLIFLNVPFAAMKFLWLFNGIAQSLLWPNLISALSETLRYSALSKAVLAMSSTVAVGTFLAYGGSALFTYIGNFRFSFLLGAVAMTITAIFWASSYNRAFKKASIEAPSPVVETKVKELEKKPASAGKGLLSLIIILGSFAVINNLVKDGLTTWMPRFLKEAFALPDSLTMILTLVLPVVGFFGATCAAFVYKKIPSFVLHGGLWFLLASALLLSCIMLLNTNLWWLMLLLFGLISLSMHGINNIVTSMAPLYMREKISSGVLVGILNGCCYLGSTLSSYGLGAVADAFDWGGVFWLLLVAGCIPIVISAVYFVFTRKKQG